MWLLGIVLLGLGLCFSAVACLLVSLLRFSCCVWFDVLLFSLFGC